MEPIFEVSKQGDRDAVAILNEAFSAGARSIAIPAERLGDEFFDLKTGIAGEMLQKFVNYGVRVGIVGDISKYSSSSLRDFVIEANRGNEIWFVATLQEMQGRLRDAGLGGAV